MTLDFYIASPQLLIYLLTSLLNCGDQLLQIHVAVTEENLGDGKQQWVTHSSLSSHVPFLIFILLLHLANVHYTGVFLYVCTLLCTPHSSIYLLCFYCSTLLSKHLRMFFKWYKWCEDDIELSEDGWQAHSQSGAQCLEHQQVAYRFIDQLYFRTRTWSLEWGMPVYEMGLSFSLTFLFFTWLTLQHNVHTATTFIPSVLINFSDEVCGLWTHCSM